MDKIEQARQVLKDAGYYVDNLWTVEDVKGVCKCEDVDAMYILDKALNNEATMEQIWFSIKSQAEFEGLELIEE